MTVVSVKSQTDPEVGASVYKIELSDGSLFSIKTSYLSPASQGELFSMLNKALSVEEEQDFRFAAACFQAEQAALRLLARAEQTSLGLSNKLARRGHSAPCVQAVVSHLTELEILSDARYARLWLQARLARRGESPRYLIMALGNRGIDRNIAVAALKSVLNFEGESLLLKKYLQKNRLKSGNALNDQTIFDKTTDALRSKLKYEGFSSAVIQSLWEAEDL